MHKLIRLLSRYHRNFQCKMALLKALNSNKVSPSALNWERSLQDPSEYYLDCVRFFHGPEFPATLKAHRKYFTQQARGFGEDAFHVMWRMIFQELHPKAFLELGVYRGQTLSLAALLQQQVGIKGSVTGISPFTASGDSVSDYRGDVDYYLDTLANFSYFGLPAPDLVRAFSTDKTAQDRISRQLWDVIYIDGNHDYVVAKADWDLCRTAVRKGGLIVLDDASLGTKFSPPAFATAGHPGPSQVAGEVDASEFSEVLRVGHNRVFRKL
jgi:hypothetical protein